MRTFGFDASENMNIYRIISGILFWNKIEFQDESNSGCSICESSTLSLERAAQLLGLERKEIVQVLTKHIWRPQYENIQ